MPRHIEIHRSGLVRKRGGHGSAGNDSVIASILGIIGVTGVVTRFRSFETFEDQAYSAYAQGHDRRYAIDSTKLQTELGWRPTHTDFE